LRCHGIGRWTVCSSTTTKGVVVHSIIHPHLAQATSPATPPTGRHRPPRRGHPPPGRLRGGAARTLALAASRIDRESARRAIA
jgi:hypothetical protein